MIRWILMLVAALAVAPAGAELYKWVDADGNVHYTDTPPPTSARKTERKKLTDKPSPSSIPYSLQQAVKHFPVTLFTYDCGEGCTKAVALLAKRGIPHSVKDPNDSAIREELKKATGGDEVVPVLVVGRQALKGYKEDAWNTALDSAGYSSSPLMPPVPAGKPKPATESAKPAGDSGQAPPKN